jgi:hypothetical protein
MALQTAVDARAAVDEIDAGAMQLVLDPPRSPPGMFTAELTNDGLDIWTDLVRASGRPSRAIGERDKSALFLTSDPVVHRLT